MTSPSLRDLRLAARYQNTPGAIAFVDESYRPRPRDGEPAFYSMTAVTFAKSQLDHVREVLTDIAGGRYWHTTEAHEDGRLAEIARMTRFLARETQWNVVTVDVPLSDRDDSLERARATCLAALTREVTRGTGPDAVRLIVADRNKDPHLNRSDERVVAMLRAVGEADPDVALYHGRMAHEPVLWAADVASWSAYRAISVDDGRWIAPLRDVMTVIDARTGKALDMKQPQAAAASDAVTAPWPGAQQSTPLEGPQTAVASGTSVPGTPDTGPAFTRGSTVIDDLARRVARLRVDAGPTGVREGNTPEALAARVANVRRRPPAHGVDAAPADRGPAPQV